MNDQTSMFKEKISMLLALSRIFSITNNPLFSRPNVL